MTHSGFQSRCGAEWVNAWCSAQIGITCRGLDADAAHTGELLDHPLRGPAAGRTPHLKRRLGLRPTPECATGPSQVRVRDDAERPPPTEELARRRPVWRGNL